MAEVYHGPPGAVGLLNQKNDAAEARRKRRENFLNGILLKKRGDLVPETSSLGGISQNRGEQRKPG